MRIVVDTNVLVSGVFFTGPPYEILRCWRDGKLQLCVSAEILQEYVDVGSRLAESYPAIDVQPFLALIAAEAELHDAPPLSKPVSDDPDDDKFIACAIVSGSRVIVSGDRHLLRVSGYAGIEVMRPRAFVEEFLD